MAIANDSHFAYDSLPLALSWPDSMYVCICKQITDKDIETAIAEGHTDLDALGGHLGLGLNCGSCRGYTRQIISEITGNSSPTVYGD